MVFSINHRHSSYIWGAAFLGWLLIFPFYSFGQGTAFTYQGRLNDGPNPANGSYDFQFRVYESSTNGSQPGPVLTNAATAVSNGLFTVTLDFGNQFPGASRWLEIAVQTNGSSGFITLSPRQPITPAPYAITAGGVIPGGIPFSGLSASAQLQLTNAANGVAAAAVNPSSIAANLPGNMVSYLLPPFSLSVFSPTNIYYISNCPDSTYNGYYYFIYSTNSSDAFLTNTGSRWLSIYNSETYSALQTTNTYDPDQLAGVQVFDNIINGGQIPSTNWENTVAGANIPLMACYGILNVITNQVQFTVNAMGAGTLTATNIIVKVNTNSTTTIKQEGGSTSGNNLIFDAKSIGPSPVINMGNISFQLAGAPQVGIEAKAVQNGSHFINILPKAVPEWQTRIGGGFFQSLQVNDYGQVDVGWIEKAGGYSSGDTNPIYGPAWLNVYGQGNYTNGAALYLAPGSLCTNTSLAVGIVQFVGTNLFLTYSNLAGVTNTRTFAINGDNINGTFTGNGSGLTSLNASQLTGTLPTASLPGITTNVSAAGITFYVTNGLIMRVSMP